MSTIGSNSRADWPLAVVVGAGGLGMATARKLGQSHRLLLADRDEAHLARQIARLAEEGHDAAGLRCDVTSRDDIAALARQAGSTGQVRTLAHVVGVSTQVEDPALILAINLAGAQAMAEAFRPVLAPGGAGVFVSSSSAHMGTVPESVLALLQAPDRADLIPALTAALGGVPNPGQAYSLSKAALNRMCQRLAASWGAAGLRIVSISPGLIATPMGAEAYKSNPAKYRLFEAVPLGREATMLEIANIIGFLASDQASYISGIDILVDGGLLSALKFGALA